jgi:diguanylate cyclase (GGDEF)-like protein/PAS domain S-box-containing protein
MASEQDCPTRRPGERKGRSNRSLVGPPTDENAILAAALNEAAMLAVTDARGRICEANARLCEVSGYDRDELIGRDHRILKSGLHPNGFFQEMYGVIAGGATWHGEVCNQAKSGRLYWVDLTIIPRRDRTGQVDGYTSIQFEITGRKVTEADLERSEQLRGSIGSAVSEGLVVQDGDGAIVYVNPAAERMLGLSRDALLGQTSLDPGRLAIRDDGSAFPDAEHPAMLTLLTGEPQRDVVMGLRRAGGAVIWLSISSVEIPTVASGGARSVLTALSDITELRRTRQILTESIEAIPDGFVVFDQSDRLVICNEAYRTIYQASAPAIRPGASFAEIVRFGLQEGQYPEAGTSDPERSAWLQDRITRHARPSRDYIQSLPDGRWVQVRERRLSNGDTVGLRTDVTEVKRETSRLRAIIENFPGGISLLDADLNLVACNDAFRTLLDLPDGFFENGLPTLEAIFRANAERGEYGPEPVDQLVAARMASARKNQPQRFERVRPNGTVLEIRAIPISGGGYITTYLDVTERHAAERLRVESEHEARQKSDTLQVTLAHMSQGLSMFDDQDRLIVWNDRFVEIYRLPASLLGVGTPARTISAYLSQTGFHETDQPQWRKRLAAGETVTAQLGSRAGRTIKVVYTPVAGSGWVATHEDVTEQIRVQNELARQTEQLARINMQLDAALSNMSQGICLLDANGGLVLTNKRLREMYQFSEADVPYGLPVQRLVELFAEKYGAPGFSVEGFVSAIPSETDRLLHLSDGRIVHVHRAQTPDGGWVATHEDITERERSSRQIVHLAFHDPLTGLANRAEFHQQGATRLSRDAGGMAILLIDLDRFKSVNDTFGHAMGDVLLKLAADRMSAIVQADDLVARLGGDEFAILQTAQDNQREAAVSLAVRLIEALARPFDLKGRQALIGASIGIALQTDRSETIETLLHRADLALYEVKSSGRNSSLIYDEALGNRAHEKHELEADLSKAIAAGELELHYQPIVSLVSRQLCGVEGLLRWRHPSKGLLLPDRFIQIAEDSGLIVPLGEFVIRQACADAVTWPDHIKVAINISPTHIRRRTLLDAVAESLLQTGLDAERLEIEVTETVLMQQDEDILSELHQLRHLGLSVALDDFGTGFSSLSHLRMFSFDKVKIDRTFVAEITERPDSAAIVCAVTGLARALEMTTTAEGVETEHQAQILLAAGCAQGQGYLFGKPQPAASLCETFFDSGASRQIA